MYLAITVSMAMSLMWTFGLGFLPAVAGLFDRFVTVNVVAASVVKDFD